MPTGTVSRLNLSHRFGFVECPGRAELKFEESDLVDIEFNKELRGRKVVYNAQGDRAEGVRSADA